MLVVEGSNATILGIVSLVAVLATILISRRLQGAVSRPILELAALAQAVSDQKDYSVRAKPVRSVS
jgi:hypothetical protein